MGGQAFQPATSIAQPPKAAWMHSPDFPIFLTHTPIFSVRRPVTESSFTRARIYTGVLHFYLQPSATMVFLTCLDGQVCPPFGHTCPTRLLLPMSQNSFPQPFTIPARSILSPPWWLKAEGRNAKLRCNARARVGTLIKDAFISVQMLAAGRRSAPVPSSLQKDDALR